MADKKALLNVTSLSRCVTNLRSTRDSPTILETVPSVHRFATKPFKNKNPRPKSSSPSRDNKKSGDIKRSASETFSFSLDDVFSEISEEEKVVSDSVGEEQCDEGIEPGSATRSLKESVIAEDIRSGTLTITFVSSEV